MSDPAALRQAQGAEGQAQGAAHVQGDPASGPSAARVGIVMGSDSDWPVMSAAAEALAEFDVPYEVGVYSAHRTPQRMLDYATSAAGRGLRVIDAGAGGAAHMPGMVAAATPLPVIGVRIGIGKP